VVTGIPGVTGGETDRQTDSVTVNGKVVQRGGCRASNIEIATVGPEWDVLGIILYDSRESLYAHVLQVVRIAANEPKMDRTVRCVR
jgi:hypothetical protein